MDAAAIKSLKQRREAARRFEHTVEGKGWTFQMLRPTDLAAREAMLSPEALRSPVRFQTDRVYAALVGWSGPTIGDVDSEASGDAAKVALPFDRELFDALFEDNADVLDELGAALARRMTERRKQREEEEKNSQSSAGPAPS